MHEQSHLKPSCSEIMQSVCNISCVLSLSYRKSKKIVYHSFLRLTGTIEWIPHGLVSPCLYIVGTLPSQWYNASIWHLTLEKVKSSIGHWGVREDTRITGHIQGASHNWKIQRGSPSLSFPEYLYAYLLTRRKFKNTAKMYRVWFSFESYLHQRD